MILCWKIYLRQYLSVPGFDVGLVSLYLGWISVKCLCFCYVTPIHFCWLICPHLVSRVCVNIYHAVSVSGDVFVTFVYAAVFLAGWVCPHLVVCLYVVSLALGFV